MRILFLSSSFNGGGITTFAHEVANAYSNDNEFYLVVGNDKKAPIVNSKVKIIYYDCGDVSISNALFFIKLINEDIQPNVILGSNAKILPVIAKFLNNNIRIITVSHSLKYTEADVAAVAHRYCDHIIAGSEYNKEYMATKFRIKDQGKIKVIYNFVKEYAKQDEFLRQKKSSLVPKIVFTGGCAPSKSPEIVVQVINKLINTDLHFHFVWVGGTYIFISRYFPFLHLKDIRQLVPDDSRITFTGRLPTREDAERELASANITFAPSRREGCPMAFLEAIRVGTVAVVADYPNFNREIVEKGGFGYVCPHNDLDVFVNTIIDICKHPELSMRMYDKSQEIFHKELSFDVWKQRIDALLYSNDSFHQARKKKILNLSLYLNVFKLKLLDIESKVKLTFNENIYTLFQLWRLKK